MPDHGRGARAGRSVTGDDVLAAARQVAAAAEGVPVDRVRLVESISGTPIALGERVVVKVHAPGTDVQALGARLRLAADPALRGCVLAPLRAEPVRLGGAGPGGRWGTLWPRVDPLPPDVEAAPWAEVGALLARLHRLPLPDRPGRAPVQGSVDRLRAALDRLAAVVDTGRVAADLAPAVEVVRDAARRLPAACWDPEGGAGRPRTIVHGDWHLGQLGRLPAGDPDGGGDGDRWRLLDVDDLGLGDPAWDLARPAAFWAAGLMPDPDWDAFVRAYRRAGGPALPAEPSDPWPAVDAAAQASVVLASAGAVRRAVARQGPPEEMDVRLLEVCARLPGGRS
jgi:Ser/Thr protein kinase RdoA (MazF antagonist)